MPCVCVNWGKDGFTLPDGSHMIDLQSTGFSFDSLCVCMCNGGAGPIECVSVGVGWACNTLRLYCLVLRR